MLTALAILGVLAALFLAAALATREGEAMAPASPDVADLALPEGPLAADDVRGLQFSLAARGYRMSEVDAALERLAADLEARDRRLAELEGTSYEPAPVAAGQPAAEPVAEPVGEPAGAPVAAQTDAAFGAELDFPEVAPPEESSDGVLDAPDLAVGQAPVEPVDAPVRSTP